MKRILALTLMAFVATACASGLQRSKDDGPLTRYDGYIGEPIRGFTAMNPQSWSPVGRDQLILWTSLNDAWLIKVWANCTTNLQFANSVRVTSTVNTISTFDRVLIGRDSCPIEEIRPIDIRRWKADRKEAETN
ncbi:MAG: DUF6491 family protein [Steroidobacteraceae bacterium]